MKNFLSGLFMFVILFSFGSVGYLFFSGYTLWGIVSAVLSVTNAIAFFTNKTLPTLKDITE